MFLNNLKYYGKLLAGITVFLLATAVFTSCEEAIDIDLSDINQSIVIVGTITDQIGVSGISVSQTENVFKQSSTAKIMGAKVIVSDDNGLSEILTETSQGNFIFNSLKGEQGRTYKLRVEYNRKEYSGVSSLKKPMTIDSIRFETTQKTIIWGISYIAYKMKIYITNTIGTEDFCIIKVKDAANKNTRATVVYSDKYSDGKQSLIEESSIDYKKNEIVNVEIQSIDKAAYEYFYQLKELSDDRGLDVPDLFNINTYNPKSNLSNGALGYFYAYSSKKYQVMVK